MCLDIIRGFSMALYRRDDSIITRGVIMRRLFSSTYLDSYLLEHHYVNYTSIILAKDADVLFEKHNDGINSDTKQNISFLIPGIISILTGIAIDRHFLKSVEAPIRTILPEFDLRRDHLHRVIKIKHLLSMSSGLLWSSSMHWLRPIYYDLLNLDNTSDVLSDILVADVPGMNFNYKEWDYILLAVILEKVLDVSLNDFCQEALFDPLGIQLSDKDFFLSSKTIIYDLYTKQHRFTCSVNDILKLSQMLLNKGFYEHKKILSIGYMREMFQPQKSCNEYGYLWSLYPYGNAIIGKCCQVLILNPELNISYLLLLQNTSKKMEYRGIYAKLLENILNQ